MCDDFYHQGSAESCTFEGGDAKGCRPGCCGTDCSGEGEEQGTCLATAESYAGAEDLHARRSSYRNQPVHIMDYLQDLRLAVGDGTAKTIKEDLGGYCERDRGHRLLAYQRAHRLEPVHLMEDLQGLRDTLGDWTAEVERSTDAAADEGDAIGTLDGCSSCAERRVLAHLCQERREPVHLVRDLHRMRSSPEHDAEGEELCGTC